LVFWRPWCPCRGNDRTGGVSIPSRGFWFFEADGTNKLHGVSLSYWVSIPSRGFWFFEGDATGCERKLTLALIVSIPSRGFWFFEVATWSASMKVDLCFNPLAGILVFWSLRLVTNSTRAFLLVSIPSRGFWFFEVISHVSITTYQY